MTTRLRSIRSTTLPELAIRSPLEPRWAWRLRAVRHGLVLAGLLFAGYLAVILAPRARTVGLDAYAYWSLDLADLYGAAQGAVLGPGAFRYSPIVAQLIAPFTALPWGHFFLLYEAILLGTIVWLGRGRLLPVLAILAFPPVAVELYYGNIHLLMAAAVALGFRHPWTWAFVLLTKVTPGIGLLWFAVRREWRSLTVALAVTAALTILSAAVAPDLWRDWIGTLAGNRAVPTSNSIDVPLWLRLPIAALLVAWGARTDRRWTVPVAVTLALPIVWIHGLATLAGIAPFVGRSEPERPHAGSLPGRQDPRTKFLPWSSYPFEAVRSRMRQPRHPKGGRT